MWHSYEILPNYHYYTSGPNTEPNFIIGIDDKYQFNSKLWKSVDLTPEMLNNWFNYITPRVGYSQDTYGAFITGPNGERLGLWECQLRLDHARSLVVDTVKSLTEIAYETGFSDSSHFWSEVQANI